MINLVSLEKLDLRWNKFESLPAWIKEIEERGCIVYS